MLYTLSKDLQGRYVFSPTPFTLPISVSEFQSKVLEWCDKLTPYFNAVEVNDPVEEKRPLSLNIPKSVLVKALKDFVDTLSDAEIDLVVRSTVYTPALNSKIINYSTLKYKKPINYDFRELRICTACAILEIAVAKVLDVDLEELNDD